jgi:hypothetical protein
MSFPVTFFLNGGLFDFDLTFIAEGILFVLFSLVVTFVFITPVSQQLYKRATFIDSNLRKSNFLLAFGNQKLFFSIGILTEEIKELNRQMKLTKEYTNTQFEEEISFVKKENGKLLSQLKGEVAVKSALLLSAITEELYTLTDAFFVKRFQ